MILIIERNKSVIFVGITWNRLIDLTKLNNNLISSIFLRNNFERNHKCETTLTSFTLRVSFIHLELNERSHSGPIQKRMCVKCDACSVPCLHLVVHDDYEELSSYYSVKDEITSWMRESNKFHDIACKKDS